MNIATRRVGNVLVAELSGRLDSHSSGDIGDRIVAIAQGTDSHVVLNLEKLAYVSSAGLRVILRGAKLLQTKSGELKICCATAQVKEALETSGFNSLIRLHDTEPEAIAAFSA